MKHLKKKFKRFLAASFLLTACSVSPTFAQDMDSVEVSLITCSPHEEIYSLYGHSAIRWHDGDQDLVFNWGMFSFSKPYFALRFVFGLTDYELAAYPFDVFWPYYQRWGSSVTEQVLNLTADEKRLLQEALAKNLEPGNRVYRYNFFYNNCSTKPRDVIESCVKGQVVYEAREDYNPTFRDMVRECNRNHLWSKCGNDMLLGLKADFKTSRTEQEFLPMNLMHDFARARIYANGEYRPLVKEQRLIVAPGVQRIEPDFILSPTEVALLLLLLSIGIALYEWKRRKTMKWWDVTLMTIQSLAGIVLTVMIFSQHPTTSVNLNILLFNPLPLVFIPAIIKGKRRKWGWVLLTMLMLFAIAGVFQSYAEGISIVALCLLIRAIVNLKIKE